MIAKGIALLDLHTSVDGQNALELEIAIRAPQALLVKILYTCSRRYTSITPCKFVTLQERFVGQKSSSYFELTTAL